MAKAFWVTALLAVCVCACSAGNSDSTGSSNGSGGSQTGAAGPKVTITGKTFSGPQDLSQMLEPDKKGQRPTVLEFEKCTFQGKVTFARLEQATSVFGAGLAFRECTFEEDVDAKQVQFLGTVFLKKCRFKKQLILQATTFLAPVAMREASFDGDVLCQNMLCLREANFMDSHFFGYTLMQEARFMSKALFGNAMFHKNADFTLVRFMDGAQFDYGKFLGRGDFTGSRIEGPLTFTQVQASQLVLKQAIALAPVSLHSLTLKDSTNTEGAFFLLGPPKR